MHKRLNRRNFLLGAEAIVVAGLLNRAYAHVPPENVAGDEDFWKSMGTIQRSSTSTMAGLRPRQPRC